MPLCQRLYLGASIYTEIFGRLPGTRHSLRFSGSSSPPPEAADKPPLSGRRRTDGRTEVTVTTGATSKDDEVRNSPPFVGYQASVQIDGSNFAAEIPREPRLPPSFLPRPSLFFSTAPRSRALCLHLRRRRMKSSGNLDSEGREPQGRDMFRRSPTNSSQLAAAAAAAIVGKIVPRTEERIEFRRARLHFDVYF